MATKSIDKTYAKQLQAFGIETEVHIEGDAQKKRQIEFSQANNNIVKAIMETMEGRQWVYSKLEMCRVFTSPFVAQDPHGTSFFSGVQSVGQNLLDDIMISAADKFFTMIEEATARRLAFENKKGA